MGVSSGGDMCLQGTPVCHQGTSMCPSAGSLGWSVRKDNQCSSQILLFLYHHVLQGLWYRGGQTPAYYSGAAQGKSCFRVFSTQQRQLKKKVNVFLANYFPWC